MTTATHRAGCDSRSTHIEIVAAYYEALAADAAFMSEFIRDGLSDRARSRRAYRSAAEEAFEDVVAIHQPRPLD